MLRLCIRFPHALMAFIVIPCASIADRTGLAMQGNTFNPLARSGLS
jgi:ABC-type Fe3+-siderophore transport system permease subunit|tara:strand:- start:1769 stop:1906 length:138 start_codon:yes stop_codon:yes gene_type:complete